MTRKELVEALTANFAEDEEITFLYMDEEYGETTNTKVAVKDHTEVIKKGHWEYYDGEQDTWVKECEHIDPLTIFCRRRWMPDEGVTKVTKKVLYIGG